MININFNEGLQIMEHKILIDNLNNLKQQYKISLKNIKLEENKCKIIMSSINSLENLYGKKDKLSSVASYAIKFLSEHRDLTTKEIYSMILKEDKFQHGSKKINSITSSLHYLSKKNKIKFLGNNKWSILVEDDEK